MRHKTKPTLAGMALCIAAITVSFSTDAVAQLASNWVRIAKTPDGSIYYINADHSESGSESGVPYVTAHFIVDEKDNPSKEQASTFLEYRVRCGPRSYKLSHLAAFDANGEKLTGGPVTGRLAQVPYQLTLKGTISAQLVRRACEVAASNGKTS